MGQASLAADLIIGVALPFIATNKARRTGESPVCPISLPTDPLARATNQHFCACPAAG
jgi:hypothetical protein